MIAGNIGDRPRARLQPWSQDLGTGGMSFNGVGVAVLRRGRCEGCHVALDTFELNNIRTAPPEEVLRCEECRRILVRTPESGL